MSPWNGANVIPQRIEGVQSDYYLCITIDSNIPIVLQYIFDEDRFTLHGDDTQHIKSWMVIP
uniref:Uncharacterized protein n=1 Tax=viral metagenome TaxID=1070528 RepID=A0A6H1Z6J4_9ZZZZ